MQSEQNFACSGRVRKPSPEPRRAADRGQPWLVVHRDVRPTAWPFRRLGLVGGCRAHRPTPPRGVAILGNCQTLCRVSPRLPLYTLRPLVPLVHSAICSRSVRRRCVESPRSHGPRLGRRCSPPSAPLIASAAAERRRHPRPTVRASPHRAAPTLPHRRVRGCRQIVQPYRPDLANGNYTFN